jgi:hypothetical protein
MTQPDGQLPGDATNYSSLSAWAGRTQGDWEDELGVPLIEPISNIYNLFGQIGNPNVNQAPSGDSVFTIPTGTKYIDIIAIGGGGGGGSAFFFGDGQGGMCGTWVTRTLERGVDLSTDATTLTIHNGAGGLGGGSSEDGENGEASTVQYKDTSNVTQTITAPGGAYGASGWGGNSANTNDSSNGVGAPSQVYRNTPYYGGADASPNQPGSVPGGGGGGGSNTVGAPGGRGRVWVVARATDSE